MPRATDPATAGAALAIMEHGANPTTAARIVGISPETAHRIIRQAKVAANGQSIRIRALRERTLRAPFRGDYKREVVAALDELLTLRAAGRGR